MTPLAHAIAADMTLPMKDRVCTTIAAEVRPLDGLHFFDVTAIVPTALQMVGQIAKMLSSGDARLAFLPADRIWLETGDPTFGAVKRGPDDCKRMAWMVEKVPGKDRARVCHAYEDHDGSIHLTHNCAEFPLTGAADLGTYDMLPAAWTAKDLGSEKVQALSDTNVMVIYAMLAMINTPRVIGQRVHAPHVGLQRRLAKSRGMVGKFPLRGWTEIRLEIAAPKDVSGDVPQEAHLTGRRAMHFCRQHLRIRCGHLEFVRPHWRGDPALGIKRSRYVMEAPRA